MGFTTNADVWRCDANGCRSEHVEDYRDRLRPTGAVPHIPPPWLLVLGPNHDGCERVVAVFCSIVCAGEQVSRALNYASDGVR